MRQSAWEILTFSCTCWLVTDPPSHGQPPRGTPAGWKSDPDSLLSVGPFRGAAWDVTKQRQTRRFAAEPQRCTQLTSKETNELVGSIFWVEEKKKKEWHEGRKPEVKLAMRWRTTRDKREQNRLKSQTTEKNGEILKWSSYSSTNDSFYSGIFITVACDSF